MTQYEADTARTMPSGGYSCIVVESDGTVDGKVLATAYGKTEAEAEANAAQLAEAMNAQAAKGSYDDEFADDGNQAWIDFSKGRDLSCYTPAALAYALERQAEWGRDWKTEAESVHDFLLDLVDQGYVSEGTINRRMGENFVEGLKGLKELFADIAEAPADSAS